MAASDHLSGEQFGPLFHGTSKVAAHKIVSEGFRSGYDGNYTLTPDPKTAKDYSLNGWSREEGGAVLEFKVPPELHHHYFGHTLSELPESERPEGEVERTDGSAWTRRDVPAKYISLRDNGE